MWFDFLAENASRFGDRIALEQAGDGATMTYAAMDRLADRWATYLHQLGVGEGDRVVVLATNRAEHLHLFFACLRLGALLVPLNYRLSPAEWTQQLDHIEATCVLLGADFHLDHPAAFYLDLVTLPETTAFVAAPVDPQRPLLMLFTSGSSGCPKGVLLHGAMLGANIVQTRLNWELDSRDASSTHAPFFHTGGYNVLTLPLLQAGGRILLVDCFQPDQILDLMNAGKITVFFGVPTMFDLLARHAAFAGCDLSQLRFVISGGAPCQQAVMQVWRERGVCFRQGFGMTEVGPNCFTIDDATARRKPAAVGWPMLGTCMLLLDEDDQPVGDGGVGELCIAGPHLCAGYRNNAASTASARHGQFWRTGDLAQRDAQGCYTIVGRKKEMYISGGENVFPGEVVRHLINMADVRDAHVIGVPDQRWGEVGFAFLLTEQSYDVAAVRAFLEPHLSRYKHPRHLVCLTELPLLANGKVNRKALTETALKTIQAGVQYAS
ncbi:class I adenylate-forming enzyme family protein [Acanthopleuribacter pedis]|uniref:AMP-binding protein n=1 Tax=Acanthopleuribacter pedis TaxID=442870 RepID=A0A8J7QHA6_9BACT|nr:AMP-binding protein [Acanthopleuribacter pedis]MBO1317303.1 AMP-binding protein [Acanthopleuribacter pedis]MBO1318610.1 AMP-binding protein [Acanthopleuribacter pedis]